MESTWEAILGIVTAFVLLIAAYFAWRHVRATRLSTNAQLVVGIYERLRSPETIETLRLIYGTKPESVKQLPKRDVDKIERVLDWLDMIGHLLERGILDEYLAVEAFAGPPVLRCWHQLRQFITEVRQQRGGRYCAGVEYFAGCTVKYQVKHAPRDQWILFYPGTPGEEATINLVEKELIEPELLSKWELRTAKAKRRVRGIYNKQLR